MTILIHISFSLRLGSVGCMSDTIDSLALRYLHIGASTSGLVGLGLRPSSNESRFMRSVGVKLGSLQSLSPESCLELRRLKKCGSLRAHWLRRLGWNVLRRDISLRLMCKRVFSFSGLVSSRGIASDAETRPLVNFLPLLCLALLGEVSACCLGLQTPYWIDDSWSSLAKTTARFDSNTFSRIDTS